jgi:transposase-like protein
MNATNSNGNGLEVKTLLQAVHYFSDLNAAHDFFAKMRWPDGVVCPRCGSKDVRYSPRYRRFECSHSHDRRQFTVKTGTVMEDSPMSLDKWAIAFWLEVNAKNSISSYEIHRALGITQKSAWFMLHRVRHALKTGSFTKFAGDVESDESFIGGAAKNMHKKQRERTTFGVHVGKTIVHGLLERHSTKQKSGKKISQVKTTVINDTGVTSLLPIIVSSVERGSNLYTDTLKAYTNENFRSQFVHKMIDHAEAYVKDKVIHTNGLENFWALFKRCIKGTHVSIEPAHLEAYLDSEVFRFNNRDVKDSDRFQLAASGYHGKRLTYKALTGASEVAPGCQDKDAGSANLPN